MGFSMFVHSRFILGAALLVAAISVSAATQTTVGFDSTRAERLQSEQARHREALLNRTPRPEPKAGTGITAATPALPRANPLTPYPPSCLADPLPDQTSGPVYSQNVALAAFNRNTGGADSTELVTIRIWRVACSTPPGSTFNSATLMRIDRQAQFEGDDVIYPLFPSIRVSQGSTGFDGDLSLARVAIEPNTWISDVLVDTPIINNMTFVLENYDSTQTSVFDFNLPFSIRFDNLFGSNNLFFIDVPVYNPTAQTYPAAFQDLPISGYMSTNWFDPAADGEGIVLQIYERVGDTENFVVSFGWFAYDPSGVPFWLFGQVTIPRGGRTAIASIFYRTGGGLGGNAGAADPPIPWGSATVTFPDCNNMTFNYISNPGLPAGIPIGNGTRTWTRIANINGLACQ